MNKKSILILSLTLFITQVSSQFNYGLKGGCGLSILNGMDNLSTMNYSKPSINYNWGVFGKLKISDKFYFQQEFNYFNFNQTIYSEDENFYDKTNRVLYKYNVERKYKFRYIEMPLSFNFFIHPKKYFTTGFVPGFLIKVFYENNYSGNFPYVYNNEKGNVNNNTVLLRYKEKDYYFAEAINNTKLSHFIGITMPIKFNFSCQVTMNYDLFQTFQLIDRTNDPSEYSKTIEYRLRHFYLQLNIMYDIPKIKRKKKSSQNK